MVRNMLACILIFLFFSWRGGVVVVVAEDPYQYEDWTVSYISASPLGGPSQKVIAINDQFPGPQLETTTNYNLVINVHNELDEPLLITWDGVQMRKNAWQDGVGGTNCPIPAGGSWTYHFQMKDQVGSFYYCPSLRFQKAAGGFGSIRVNPRRGVPSPFDAPADDFALLAGDWYKAGHQTLRSAVDAGRLLWPPDGILINGKGPDQTAFTVEQGKTYRFRISNVGLTQSLNFRIEGHRLQLVEVEGSYVQQTYFSSLDVHLGQSYSVLVTMEQSEPADFRMVASTRFGWPTLSGTAVLRYSTSRGGWASADGGPTAPAPNDVASSMEQARSIKSNLTAGAARLNPQGSYHYGRINASATYVLANAPLQAGGRRRYMVNGVSFVGTGTPLQLADYLKLEGVFRAGSMPERPSAEGSARTPSFSSAVLSCHFRAFVELVFQNGEGALQSWHLDGYAFFVVGMGPGSWDPEARRTYNMVDAVARTTTQVYGNHWTAIMVELNNPGLWNLRSQELQRQWLGQELYLQVENPPTFDDDHGKTREVDPPHNLLLCGKAISS